MFRRERVRRLSAANGVQWMITSDEKELTNVHPVPVRATFRRSDKGDGPASCVDDDP